MISLNSNKKLSQVSLTSICEVKQGNFLSVSDENGCLFNFDPLSNESITHKNKYPLVITKIKDTSNVFPYTYSFSLGNKVFPFKKLKQ